MKPIFHVCGISRNYGDQALISGMRASLLQQQAGLTFLTFDFKQPTEITAETVSYINEHCSGMLIGGGGMFMEGDGFKTRSGWQLNIAHDVIHQIKVPLIIYAIGYNHFPYDRAVVPNHPTFRSFRNIYENATFFSVRDKGTAIKFIEKGIRVEICPDPAIYAPVGPGVLPRGKRYIGFSWGGDRSTTRFKASQLLHFRNRVRKALRDVAEETNSVVVHIPHVSRYDMDSKRIFGSKADLALQEVAPWLYPEQIDNVPAFVGTYRQLDLMLGMRGHSNILAFAQGVPFVALGDHPKNAFFANGVGAPIVYNDATNLSDVLRFTLADKVLLKRQAALRDEQIAKVHTFSKKCVHELFLR